MSTSAVSSSSLYQQVQSYFQTRRSDLTQLGDALSSGNLANAQTAYNSINTLGQSGPFKDGQPFISQQREQDFNAIGSALQSGDLAGAQQAFATLQSTFHQSGPLGPAPAPIVPVSGPEIVLNLSNGSNGTTTATPVATSSSTTATAPVAGGSSGPEIVLNLNNASNGASPEQITINISSPSSDGAEQISLSVGNPQGSSQPEQITFNLNPNSNEQIVVNLLDGTSSTGSSSGTASASTATSGGLSVSA